LKILKDLKGIRRIYTIFYGKSFNQLFIDNFLFEPLLVIEKVFLLSKVMLKIDGKNKGWKNGFEKLAIN
jgi:hypothetical protein